MANAQLMQEELQQSVVLSEEDAEFEEDLPNNNAMMVDNTAPIPSGDSPVEDAEFEQPLDEIDNYEDEEDSEVDAIPEDDVVPPYNEEGDFEDAPADDDGADEGEEESSSNSDIHDDDDAFDVDADGEDDEDVAQSRIYPNAASGDEEEVEQEAAEEDDENEGVGAVKIKPGDTDDEESDSEDDISLASGSSDGDSAAEWEEVVEHDEDEDEESDAVDPNNCIFCKKDEENDPADEFEAYLACKGCGEHAHQQCARYQGALDLKNNASNWKCPDCASDDVGSDSEAEFARENADIDLEMELGGDVDDSDLSPTSTNGSSAPQLARDLIPNEDSMDGSRVLRKRKTSSAEGDDEVMSLRKRRKNTSDGSIQDEANQEQASAVETSTRPRPGRSLRHKTSNPDALCSIVKQSRSTLMVVMRVNPAALQTLSLNKKTRRRRSAWGSRGRGRGRGRGGRGSRGGRGGRGGRARAAASRSSRSSRNAESIHTTALEEQSSLPMAPFYPPSFSQPFYSLYDKETDELKGKPYGGILTEEQADTTKTLPTKDDRRRFDEAKQKAEEEWRNRLLAMQAEAEVPVKKSRKASGPASQIECIEFGGWEIDTWYAAPYPEEYSRNRVLYICEFCLKYMNSDYVAWRHKLKCYAKHPPGDEIYRHGSISFFEVDGRKNPVYCQNLCLLAKLFLGSKTLYYDVEPFLFYVLCEYDDLGYHFVGYFSKEKRASSQNNVSCILTLPIHQRKGYGHLLIDFSYLLTKVEEKTGSPEKPLSDMGLVSYRNYWRLIICKYLIDHMSEDKSQTKGLSIRCISDDTGMTPDDVISALEALRFLVRDPTTHVYAFRVDLPYCRKEVVRWEAKNYVKLNPKNLTWTPYVMGRSNATNFELGPALNTIAPREEDEEVKAMQNLAQSSITTGDFAISQSTSQKLLSGAESSVLESTEPNDNGTMESKGDRKTNDTDKENRSNSGGHQEDQNTSGSAVSSTQDDENGWRKVYDTIPVNRFQVFPPINTRRTGMSRFNSAITRAAPLPRTAPASSRKVVRPRKIKRSAGSTSARKASQKTSTSKRKPGGTGRGPGRWPKGTKKSDYGNADSGPGLPPAWLEREKQKQAELTPSKTGEESNTQDTVQVQVAEASNSQKGKQTVSLSTKVDVSTTETEAAPVDSADGDIVMGEANYTQDGEGTGVEET